MRIVFLVMLLLPAAGFCQEPVAGYSPSNPEAGSEISIWYNPVHKKAKLAEGEQLFCVINNLFAESFEYTNELIPLKKVYGKVQCTYLIPKHVMTLTVFFISGSSNGLDPFSLEICPLNDHGEKIAEGHPGYAFRHQWFSYPFLFPGDTAVLKIREEMKVLEKFSGKDPVGYAYSKSFGYILAGEELKSREIIREMVRNYPDHQLTFQAMDSYHYNVFAGKIECPAGAREVDSLLVEMVSRFPYKPLARSYLNGFDPMSLSLNTVESICQRWMQDEPDNPLAMMRLVDRYHQERINPEKILNLCDKGTDLILDNKLRKYMDLKGIFNRQYLGYFNSVKATALVQLGRLPEALSCIQAAKGYRPANHNDFFLEGRIWMDLQNYAEAETAFIEAMKLGNGEAREYLLSIYKTRNRSKSSFEEYLGTIMGGSEPIKAQSKPLAKDFSVTSINGETFSLSSLKGNVVILNFWNLGCGPCRAEMPELNKLVDKYSGQKVVFIAISNDKKEKVKEFLTKKEFKYKQVTDADQVFKQYEVKVLPTHCIIGKDGFVHNRFIGAGKDIFQVLDNQIKLLQ